MKKFVGLMLVSLMFVTLVAPLTAHAAVARAALCPECGAEIHYITWKVYGDWQACDPEYFTGTYEGQPARFVRTKDVRWVTTKRGYACVGSEHHPDGDIEIVSREVEYGHIKDTFLGFI